MGSNNGQIDLSKWAVKVQAIKTPRCGAASTKLGQRSGSADAILRGRCNIVATACKRHYRVLEEGENPEGRREVKWKRHKQCNAIAVGWVKFAVVGAAALPFGGCIAARFAIVLAREDSRGVRGEVAVGGQGYWVETETREGDCIS